MTDQFGVIRQVAYVVEDMDQALKYWVDFLGAGPFYMFEHSQMDDQKYRGGDSQVDVSLAVGNSGDVQIELIYCENDEASVYREFLDAGRVGVHHVGLMPENYLEACQEYESMGFDRAFECKISGTSLVYFDTVQATGHFTELWERSDAFIDFMNFVKEASVGWDGSDPVRTAAL